MVHPLPRKILDPPLIAPPVGSFWLSLSSPPSICILCEKGGHWLTRFSKFVLFFCPFLDLCWQFCLQAIHGVNITPIKLSSPVVSWCCGWIQSPNVVIQKIALKSHWNTDIHTTTRQQWFPQHLVIFCSELVLLEFRSFTFSLAYTFRPSRVVVRHYCILCCGASLPLGMPIKIAMSEK